MIKTIRVLMCAVCACALCGAVLAGCSAEPAQDQRSAQQSSAEPADQDSADEGTGDAAANSDESGAAAPAEGHQAGEPTDADAPVPEGNSVSTDFYTLYFDRGLTATVNEEYTAGQFGSGCVTGVTKDGKELYGVAVFGDGWSPQGDFNAAKAGSTVDDQGNKVTVWVFAPFDVLSQEEVDQLAARVEVH